jgi:hypothetical protein
VLELAVSVLVLLAAMSVTVKVLGWFGNERRAADRRQWAVQAASNVLERVASEPFDRVTAERTREIAAATGAAKVLPGAAWDVAVEDDRDLPVPARRVYVQLRWEERTGGWGSPVRLTTWVYRRGDTK